MRDHAHTHVCVGVCVSCAQEAYHIAESLRVPCVAVSPYLMPSTATSQVSRQFARVLPRLHAALRRNNRTSHVNWDSVEHWMWPLMDVQRWGVWRSQHLGVSVMPFIASVYSNAPLPPQVPLLYGCSPLVLPPPGTTYTPRTM